MENKFYGDNELTAEELNAPEYPASKEKAMEHFVEELSHVICADYSELNRVITVMASRADSRYKKEDFDRMCMEAKDVAEAQYPNNEDKKLETFLRLVWLDGYSSGAADISLAVKNDENGIRDAIQNYEA